MYPIIRINKLNCLRILLINNINIDLFEPCGYPSKFFNYITPQH